VTWLVDADVLIEASKHHYGFDFCPGFWQWLLDRNGSGRVVSLESVREEIEQGHDDLKLWATGRDENFFLPPDEATARALARVGGWALSRPYLEPARIKFLTSADGFLVAHGLAHGHTVVTHERANWPFSPKRVVIPHACEAMGVRCCSPFQMLREEKARFILESRP
jgi:hypothetical protein